MKKRFAVLVCALLIALVMPFSAFAVRVQEDAPVWRHAVNDDAAVLSEQTANDVTLLNERSSVQFYVATRHFLGGAQAQNYCDQLFAEWSLGENEVLLLLVIGEERYAVTAGKDAQRSISQEQMNSLLSSKLRQPFIQERDYDGAVGAFLTAAAVQAARSEGWSLATAGLFGNADGEMNDQYNEERFDFDYWAGNWWNGFFGDDDVDIIEKSGDVYFDDYEYEVYVEDSGFSLGKLIFIGIVLLVIVNNRRKQGKSGLGMLGWFVASKGMDELNKMGRGKTVVRRSAPRSRPSNFSKPRGPRPPRR